MINSLAGMLSRFKVKASEDETVESLATKVKSTLSEKSKFWLLIYDNAPSVESLRNLIPQNGGHVLITTRDQFGWHEKEKLDLGVFQPQESVRFLLDETGRETAEENCVSALEVAEELGHLPLALSQAASYMNIKRVSFKSYLEAFKAKKSELLSHHPNIDGYPYTVSTTWSMTMEALPPLASKLMAYFSYLDINNIPLSLFDSSIVDSFRAVESNIDELVHYSMIKRSEDKVSIHPLVKTVTNLAAEPLKAEHLRKLVTLFTERKSSRKDKTFDSIEMDKFTIERLRNLLPHALRVFQSAEHLNLEENVILGLRIGAFLNREHFYEDGVEILKRLNTLIQENEEFKKYENVVRNNLINSYINMDRYETLKSISLEELPALSQAVVEHCLFHYSDAEILYKQAITELKEKVGEKDAIKSDHLNLALAHKGLGELYYAMNKMNEALEHLKTAEDIYYLYLGSEDNDDMGSTQAYLARVYQVSDSQRAIQTYEKALRIFEGLNPHGNPEMLRCLINYAEMLINIGKRQEADVLYEKAIAMAKRLYEKQSYLRVGADNPGLGWSVFGQREEYEDSRFLREAYGSRHPSAYTQRVFSTANVQLPNNFLSRSRKRTSDIVDF